VINLPLSNAQGATNERISGREIWPVRRDDFKVAAREMRYYSPRAFNANGPGVIHTEGGHPSPIQTQCGAAKGFR